MCEKSFLLPLSEGHVGKDVLSGENGYGHPCVGIVHWEGSKVHVAEQIKTLWKLIRCHDHVRLLDHVGPKVDEFVGESLSDVLHFGKLAICGVKVRAEVVPVEHLFGFRGDFVVFFTGEADHGFVAFVTRQALIRELLVIFDGVLEDLVLWAAETLRRSRTVFVSLSRI